MSKNCDIMKRMKENYENRAKTFLTRRIPVIIRLDGKAFHTYTRGLNKPFDEGLIEDMQLTAQYLCENIQGAKVAYTQSDEISILLTDYDKLTSDAWFNYSVNKMSSISASMATARFNQLRLNRHNEEVLNDPDDIATAKELCTWTGNDWLKIALFDSRAFNVPKEEVANYFLARQKDAVKNSVSMLAQSLYSHKELHKKNQKEMLVMCEEKGHVWRDLDFSKKRGSTITKNTYINDMLVGDCADTIWYQPDSKDSMFPNDKGRALQFAEASHGLGEDWCDIEIKKIRSKWETIETPKTFNEEWFKHNNINIT